LQDWFNVSADDSLEARLKLIQAGKLLISDIQGGDMLKEAPLGYALIFFLGLVLYTPVMLFSTGKYKAGLKCAASVCLWLIMMTGTLTLISRINPQMTSSFTMTPMAGYETSEIQNRPPSDLTRKPAQRQRIGQTYQSPLKGRCYVRGQGGGGRWNESEPVPRSGERTFSLTPGKDARR
jgi:hypothetical protein